MKLNDQILTSLRGYATKIVNDVVIEHYGGNHAKKDELHPGELTFNFLPPKQGRYRLWAQLKLDGSAKETFVPFDLDVGI